MSGNQTTQNVFNQITQDHINSVVHARNALINCWGTTAISALYPLLPLNGAGLPISVTPNRQVQAGFLPGAASKIPIDDAISAQFSLSPAGKKIEIQLSGNDWSIFKRSHVQKSPYVTPLRQHLGQLLFHEMIHSIDPRFLAFALSGNAAVAPGLAYLSNPCEVTAWAGSMAWELRVGGSQRLLCCKVSRRWIKHMGSVPRVQRKDLQGLLLQELQSCLAVLGQLTVPP